MNPDFSKLETLMRGMEDAFPYMGRDTVICMALQRLAMEIQDCKRAIEALAGAPRS
jgi:hypothetical protein